MTTRRWICETDGSVTICETDGSVTIAVVWHFWIAVPLAVAGIVAIVATIAGYLQKVTYKRYPRD